MFRRYPGRLLALVAAALWLPAQAGAQGVGREQVQPFWVGVGLGGGTLNSLAPAPSAGRDALAASVEAGYRFHPQWAVGLELGVVAPTSGCPRLDCGRAAADFAPSFTRMFTFTEYRLPESGWRLRAGIGVSRFCYRSHWSPDAWSWVDTLNLLFVEDYLFQQHGGSGAWRCDARQHALGGSLSVGYDWPLRRLPASMGVRLSAEAADYSRTEDVALPAFRHRALVLTLHMNLR